jgi:hypothetical protein
VEFKSRHKVRAVARSKFGKPVDHFFLLESFLVFENYVITEAMEAILILEAFFVSATQKA